MSLSDHNNQPPTQVAPNPKCSSCEHFSSQLGVAGMCGIGTFPQHCGDGSDPAHGYRPFAGGMITVEMMSGVNVSNPGADVPTDNFTIPMQIIELAKSLAVKAQEERGCQLHRSMRGDSGMSMSPNAPAVVTMCRCLKGASLADSIRKGLPERFQCLDDDSVLGALKGNSTGKRR